MIPPGSVVSIGGLLAVRFRELAEDPMEDVISWRWANNIKRGPSSLDFDKGFTVLYRARGKQ